jgi:MarR family 2-MHQ and catechol resistance regulon transcriptional repressor
MPTRYRGSDGEVRALNAFITLVRASEAVSVALHRRLAGKRLTSSQFGVLEALFHLGPLCQGDLASKLLRSGASTTSVVEGLEKRGFVVRQRTEEDKRFVRVALTGKGRRLIQEIFPDHAATVARLLGALDAKEQDELRRLCRKLGRAVEASTDSSSGNHLGMEAKEGS